MISKNQSSSETNYPRPQMRRAQWSSLNGIWRFAFDSDNKFLCPRQVSWNAPILVPFCPESKMSGIEDTSFHKICWYEREFKCSPPENFRTLLHFGAVDYTCQIWVNDAFVGSHEGGFSSFHFDISAYIDPSLEEQRVSLRVEDDPLDLAKPRGKQDWKPDPHSIWYPRTTGIWQSVWIEYVPSIYIERICWTPHLERWEISCEAFMAGDYNVENLELKIELRCAGQLIAKDSYHVILGEIHRRIALSDPGIDDFRNELLWSPEKPTLIDATAELWKDGEKVDSIESYTALRSVNVRKDRFMLNGRPYYLRLVLDQGYWPESLMTAPDLDAHRRDIELTKQMGFNGVRKHQKIEDPNYLYWADRLGLLVFVEMPSAYRFTHDGVERLAREWIQIIDRDRNHPCVAVWVPFNESWGVPDLQEKEPHRNCVQALYHLTRTLDGTRPVIGNDGWESLSTDIVGIHDYEGDAQRLYERYSAHMPIIDLLTRRQPAGRALLLEDYPHEGQPIMLTEFGGIAFKKSSAEEDKGWGYSTSGDADDFKRRYSELLEAVNRLEVFAGFCYTQFADTFQEVNGLLYADRSPKIPLSVIAAATKGLGGEPELKASDSKEASPATELLSSLTLSGGSSPRVN